MPEQTFFRVRWGGSDGGGDLEISKTTAGHIFILVAFFVRTFRLRWGGGGKILKIEMSDRHLIANDL